jgi:hypothetical protein
MVKKAIKGDVGVEPDTDRLKISRSGQVVRRNHKGKSVWLPDELLERVDEIVVARKQATPWTTVNRQSVVGELLAEALDRRKELST